MAAETSQSHMRCSSVPAAITTLTELSAALFSLHGETRRSTQPEFIFRVNGDLVIVPMSVSDRKGNTVLGLTSDDFTVLDDKVRQDIVSFVRWEVPSSTGVIFDVSGSMRGTESAALMAARARGRLQLDRLAAETGGRLFTIDAATQLSETASNVGDLIRNQYLIGYKPPYDARNGKGRQIRVRIQSTRNNSHLRINAKGGYYVPSE